MCLEACCSWRGAETFILGSAHSTAYCIGREWGRGSGPGGGARAMGDPWGLGGVGLSASGKAWFLGLSPRSRFSPCIFTPPERQHHRGGGPGERLTSSVLPDDVGGMPSAESSPPAHLFRQASFRCGVESWAGLCQESGCRGEGRVWTSLPLWARGEASGPNTRLLGSQGLVWTVSQTKYPEN